MFYSLFRLVHSMLVCQFSVSVYFQVMTQTARLVAQWQCVGFCHGVLNTDNMSILGLTLDYGPFGFMERYAAESRSLTV